MNPHRDTSLVHISFHARTRKLNTTDDFNSLMLCGDFTIAARTVSGRELPRRIGLHPIHIYVRFIWTFNMNKSNMIFTADTLKMCTVTCLLH